MDADVIGQTIGSYRILRQLGAGAMGQVYLAEHRHLKRQAALKLLARELVDRPELLERFFMEARATSAIAHPGIVQIFDCEVDATGRPYIVMEYLDGETLAAVMARQSPLPALAVARLGRSIAEALDAAHTKQIVHRDLKPDNMFVRSDPPDSIKLVDFGIAKLAGDFKAAQMHQTRTGAMMGTPLYMSPEQCRDSASIDYRTDLYSLGCILHEMLTGRPPFLRDNLGDLVVAHLTEPPPDPRALVPSVPAPLAALTMSLLQKDPRARPGNMRDVATQLMTFVARMTTAGGPESASRKVTGTSILPVPVRSTLGDSASELVIDRGGGESPDDVPDDEFPPPRRRAPLLIAAVVVLVLGGSAAALLLNKNSGPDKNSGPNDKTATASPTTPPPTPPPAPATTAAAVAPAPVAPAPPAAKHPTPAKKEVAAAEVTPPAGSKKEKPGARPPTGTPPATTPAPAATARPAGTKTAATTGAATTTPPTSAEPPAPRPPAETAGAEDLTGTWEGPWSDPGHQQQGRMFLQVSAGSSVSGWIYNAGVQQSYRMTGTVNTRGDLDLKCECPAGQEFTARGAIRHAGADEVKGNLSLSTAAGVFGRSHVVLHRSNAPR